MKSCKEGSSWTNSPQKQQRNGEVTRQSVTWIDRDDVEHEVEVGKAAEKPGDRTQLGWLLQADVKWAQLPSMRKSPRLFSLPGS